MMTSLYISSDEKITVANAVEKHVIVKVSINITALTPNYHNLFHKASYICDLCRHYTLLNNDLLCFWLLDFRTVQFFHVLLLIELNIIPQMFYKIGPCSK